MKKMIFESDHPMGILKELTNGEDVFGEWQFFRDDLEWINGEQIPCKIYRRVGWAYLEQADFDAVETYRDSPLYHLWENEGINGCFSQYKRVTSVSEYVFKPTLEKVEGVEQCRECRGTGYKFNKIVPKKFTKDEVW